MSARTLLALTLTLSCFLGRLSPAATATRLDPRVDPLDLAAPPFELQPFEAWAGGSWETEKKGYARDRARVHCMQEVAAQARGDAGDLQRGFHPAERGALLGEWRRLPNLPPALRSGLFADDADARWWAALRLSNAAGRDAADWMPDGRGMGVILFDDKGRRMDWPMTNSDRPFGRTADHFLSFIEAMNAGPLSLTRFFASPSNWPILGLLLESAHLAPAGLMSYTFHGGHGYLLRDGVPIKLGFTSAFSDDFNRLAPPPGLPYRYVSELRDQLRAVSVRNINRRQAIDRARRDRNYLRTQLHEMVEAAPLDLVMWVQLPGRDLSWVEDGLVPLRTPRRPVAILRLYPQPRDERLAAALNRLSITPGNFEYGMRPVGGVGRTRWLATYGPGSARLRRAVQHGPEYDEIFSYLLDRAQTLRDGYRRAVGSDEWPLDYYRP